MAETDYTDGQAAPPPRPERDTPVPGNVVAPQVDPAKPIIVRPVAQDPEKKPAASEVTKRDIRPAPTQPPAEIDPVHTYPGDEVPR